VRGLNVPIKLHDKELIRQIMIGLAASHETASRGYQFDLFVGVSDASRKQLTFN